MKTVAILQSNYIPWKGYFDIIKSVDEFVFLESVQYTTRDWRNRNQIKTAAGPRWLTIPVNHVCRSQLISETEICDSTWANSHVEQIRNNYRASPHWRQIEPFIAELYAGVSQYKRLSEINRHLVKKICDELGIDTPLLVDNDVLADVQHHAASERLLQICLARGATTYLSGPSAKSYLDEELFKAHNVDVQWMQYGPYNPYPQLHGDFIHAVSILDMFANLGSDTASFFHEQLKVS